MIKVLIELALAAAGALLLRAGYQRRAYAPEWAQTPEWAQHAADAARVMGVEVGAHASYERDAAAVALVVVNRMRRYGLSAYDVSRSTGGAPTWNRSAAFNARLDAWPSTAAAREADARYQAIFRDVWAGVDPVWADVPHAGARLHFLHPSGMPVRADAPDGWKKDPRSGKWLPAWSWGRTEGGTAPHPAVSYGRHPTRLS